MARGIYRRRIHLHAHRDNEVRGLLEDDFHHFGVRLRHDGKRVTAITGEDIRVPWSACPWRGRAGR